MVIESFWNILALTHIDTLTRGFVTGEDINTTIGGAKYPPRDMSLDRVPVGKRHIYSPKTKSISQIT